METDQKHINTAFADLVYGELPTDVQLLSSLNEVFERLKSVSWSINPNNFKG